MNNSVFSQILNENKERFINKLNCDQETKDYFITFFKSHANLESKIDWNKNSDSLTADIFNLINDTAKNKETSDSKHDLYRNIRAISDIDWEANDCEILDEDDFYIYVAPVNHNGAVFCDSVQCGGAGAKWCIGLKDDDSHFYRYNCSLDEMFVMQLNKRPEDLKNDLKIMWEIGNRNASAWNQLDKKTGSVRTTGQLFPVTTPSDTTAIPTKTQLQMMGDFSCWFRNNYRQTECWERLEEIHDSVLEDNYDTDTYEEFSAAIQDAASVLSSKYPELMNSDINPYVEWESPSELFGAGEWVIEGLYSTKHSEEETRKLIQNLNIELFNQSKLHIISLIQAYHEYADKFSGEYTIRRAPEDWTLNDIIAQNLKDF